MLSLIFGGLGEFVAPRPSVRDELQSLFKGGKYDEVLKIIRDKNQNVSFDELFDSGVGLIHLAAASGSLEITIELISQGVDVCRIATNTENQPLHYAALNNHKGVVEILLRSGADPSIPNAHGMIPAELTSSPDIVNLLMRTNWMGQRHQSLDWTSPLFDRQGGKACSPDQSPKKTVRHNEEGTDEYIPPAHFSPPPARRNISITIPEESRGGLHMPATTSTAQLAEQLSARKQKPNRRYSLPPGHPAIRLVDSVEKQKGYEVREKGKSPTHADTDIADDVYEHNGVCSRQGGRLGNCRRGSGSSNGSSGGGAVAGASHALPIPHIPPSVPGCGLSDRESASPGTGDNGREQRRASPSPLAALHRKFVGDMPLPHAMHSPLNMPSARIRRSSPTTASFTLPVADDDASDDTAESSDTPSGNEVQVARTRGMPIQAIWDMSEPYPLAGGDGRLRTVSDGSDVPPPPTDAPVSTIHHDVTQMYSAQYDDTYAEFRESAGGGAGTSVNSGDFLLPPPSSSPSYPVALTSRVSPASLTERRSSDSALSPYEATDEAGPYHDLTLNGINDADTDPASPSAGNKVLPIVPVMSYGGADKDKISSSSRVSINTEPVIIRQDRSIQADDDPLPGAYGNMLCQLEKEYSLERRVLQAAKETAESYRLASTSGTKLRELFKACQQKSNTSLLDRLKADIAAEPELALSRACELGAMACDGWTLLHAAARWGNTPAVEELLQLEVATNGKAGIDVWACDLQGRVALHLAAEYSFEVICELLLHAMERQGHARAVPTGKILHPTPRKIGPGNSSGFSYTAPEDLTGSTPLGWAKRKANGRPPANIERLLFRPGDNSIIPKSPFVTRSGRTPHKQNRPSRLDVYRAHPTTSLKVAPLRYPREVIANAPSDTGAHDGLVFASSDAQGWRPTMEDRIIMKCPLGVDDEDLSHWSVFAVLDGHGGDFSSDFVGKKLPELIEVELGQIYESLALNSDFNEDALVDLLAGAVSRSCLSAETALSEQERMRVSAKHGPPFRDAPPKTELLIRDVSGTTLCMCVVGDEHLIIANIGDSRAVMACRGNSQSVLTVPLSEDHKFSLPAERSRAERAGFELTALSEGVDCLYEISNSLHKQKLRLSRTIGDFHMKWTVVKEAATEGVDALRGSYSCRQVQAAPTADGLAPACIELLPPDEQPVSCMADITVRQRELARDLFLVIACDGIWDVMTSEEVVQFVYDKISAWRGGTDDTLTMSVQNVQEAAATICDELLLTCLQKGSTDNMSLLLVLFPAVMASLEEGDTSASPNISHVSEPVYDTPDCTASPSPLYLPGTLEEDDDDNTRGPNATRTIRSNSAPSPIKATKLF